LRRQRLAFGDAAATYEFARLVPQADTFGQMRLRLGYRGSRAA